MMKCFQVKNYICSYLSWSLLLDLPSSLHGCLEVLPGLVNARAQVLEQGHHGRLLLCRPVLLLLQAQDDLLLLLDQLLQQLLLALEQLVRQLLLFQALLLSVALHLGLGLKKLLVLLDGSDGLKDKIMVRQVQLKKKKKT